VQGFLVLNIRFRVKLLKVLFADAHAHANPVAGLGAREISRRFKKKGGWFIALVSLPPWHYGLSRQGRFESYRKAVEMHLKECRAAKEEGMEVACFAGFHPADIDKLESAGVSLTDILELGERVVDYVADLCRKGVVDGIGEVGRQHYTTAPIKTSIAEIVMLRAMQYSRDYGCKIHLHLENYGVATVLTIDRLVRVIGRLEKRKLFFHHSSLKVVREAARQGYNATIPGKLEVLNRIVKELPPSRWSYLVESDYIDDPRRPCVSQCPWDIVENQLTLLKKGVLSEEDLYRINVDYIVEAYNVSPP